MKSKITWSVLLALLLTVHVALASDGNTRHIDKAGVHANAPFTVKIIGFNDYHGNLESPGSFGVNAAVPPAQRPAVGGADYLAGYVDKLKSENPYNVVVGAGDFVGASPLISAAFHDEPAVETLNRIGVEFNAVGNHEFDKGPKELLRLQHGGCKSINGHRDPNSCKGALVGTPVPFEGAKFKWLSANVVWAATGKTLLPAYGIKTFKGVKIAFIGMTLKATPTIVTPTSVADLTFRDEAETVNRLIPKLRAQGIKAIVVLVHQGGVQTGTLADINGCEGNLAGSAIADIVSRLDDQVDLVISGHTHAAYNCKLPNAKGRAIPVTSASAFGRVLTDIDVTIDPRKKDIIAVKATNLLVSRDDPSITPDAQVTKIVQGYKALVSPVASAVIGSIARELPNSRVDAACNMPAGNLVADAQLSATKGLGHAQIAFMNGGGVRNPGFVYMQSSAHEGNGNVTYGEAFTAQPFGNSLVTMTLTAQDIKDVLEEQFAGCRGQSPVATRVMLPSAGFKYTWNGAQACNARISNVTLTSGGTIETLVDEKGVVVDPNKTYRVTVNNFMADGGDGYSTFKNKGTNRLGGPQDIDALVTFMVTYKTPSAPYDPAAIPEDRGTPRINRVGGTICPTGSDVNP
jgi:5'-nucleotidase